MPCQAARTERDRSGRTPPRKKYLQPPSHVITVIRDGSHRFSNLIVPEIGSCKGLGVKGDAHCGEMAEHRSCAHVEVQSHRLCDHCHHYEDGPSMLGHQSSFLTDDAILVPVCSSRLSHRKTPVVVVAPIRRFQPQHQPDIATGVYHQKCVYNCPDRSMLRDDWTFAFVASVDLVLRQSVSLFQRFTGNVELKLLR